jgi:hypothetical protein
MNFSCDLVRMYLSCFSARQHLTGDLSDGRIIPKKEWKNLTESSDLAAYNKRQARKKQARYSADMRKKNRGLAAAIARMQVDNK